MRILIRSIQKETNRLSRIPKALICSFLKRSPCSSVVGLDSRPFSFWPSFPSSLDLGWKDQRFIGPRVSLWNVTIGSVISYMDWRLISRGCLTRCFVRHEGYSYNSLGSLQRLSVWYLARTQLRLSAVQWREGMCGIFPSAFGVRQDCSSSIASQHTYRLGATGWIMDDGHCKTSLGKF